MIDVVSIILIFILDSLPLEISRGFLIMPYLAFVGYKKSKTKFIYYLIIAIIMGINANSPLYTYFFVVMNILFYYVCTLYFHYNIVSVAILSAIQLLSWKMFIDKPLDNIYILVLLYMLYFIINYFYMKKSKTND